MRRKFRNVGGGGSWWYDKVRKMLISCISYSGKEKSTRPCIIRKVFDAFFFLPRAIT